MEKIEKKQMKTGENKIKRKQEKIEKRKKIGNDREKNVVVAKGMEGIIKVLISSILLDTNSSQFCFI